MPRPSRQAVVVGVLVCTAAALAGWISIRARSCRPIEVGFWFEPVAYSAPQLGGAITARDLDVVANTARAELARAVASLPVLLRETRDTRYQIRVVDDLRDRRFRREVSIPAETRAIAGFGGQAAVSFSWLASSATAYAPPGASRYDLLVAIGTGIGRSAAHELAHLLAPTAPIDDSTDRGSYEYRSAARPEQFSGEMHWGPAWPYLEARMRQCTPRSLRAS
jgi:hypothetical protein